MKLKFYLQENFENQYFFNPTILQFQYYYRTLFNKIDIYSYFLFILFYLGRQPHHGFYEVFKTDQLKNGKMSEIIEKVQLTKLTEYIQMNQKKGYVMRQHFIQGELIPSLKQCFCGQYVNPDQILVLCSQCEKAFHVQCLLKKLEYEIVNCNSCREQLSNKSISKHIKENLKTRNYQLCNESYSINKYQKQNKIEDEGEEEDIEREGKGIDLDKIVQKIKTKEDQLNTIEQIIKQKNDLIDTKTKQIDTVIPKAQINQQLKQISQPFKNISISSIEKIKIWVEKYRKLEFNLSSFEKKRQEVREKFFSVILYGIEELKDLWQQEKNQISEQEKEVIQMSDTTLFQFIKNLALDIEVFIHIKFNVQHKAKLEPTYIDRCKLIYLHMKDDKNLELRRKVISKQFQAEDLCNRDERDLYNPDKRKQFQEIAMRVIKLNYKDREDFEQIHKEAEESSITKHQSITYDDQQCSEINNDDDYQSNSLQKQKLIEYSVEKSLLRFKKRIIDELGEKERLLMLDSLQQIQLYK